MSRARELEAGFASDDPESRRRAVEFLRDTLREPHAEELALDAEVASRYLLRALGDSDWRVRKQAIEVARWLAPSPELLNGLLCAFEPGDNVGLRNAAVEALGAFSESAVQALASKLTLARRGWQEARCGSPGAHAAPFRARRAATAFGR